MLRLRLRSFLPPLLPPTIATPRPPACPPYPSLIVPIALKHTLQPQRKRRISANGTTSQEETIATTTTTAVDKKSKGQKKREAHRAVQWGFQLASLSSSQLRQAVRWAELEDEVFEAVMLAKKLGVDTKNGRRRQFNFIGGLLRHIDPDLMESVIKAARDGDVEGIFTQHTEIIHQEEDTDLSNDEEADERGDHKETAERWLQGLISGDPIIFEEIFSIRNVDFDRQELRKLLRDVNGMEVQRENAMLVQENSSTVSSMATVPSMAEAGCKARKALDEFLLDLAIRAACDKGKAHLFQ